MNSSTPTPAEGPLEQNQLQQLKAFLRRMVRAWPVALIVVGLAACAFGGFMYYRDPAYRSETVLLYTQGVGMGNPTASPDGSRNASVRLKEVLMSRPKLGAIVTTFSLYPDIRKKYGPEDAVEELKRHVEFRAPGGDTFAIGYQGSSPAEAQAVTQALARAVIDGDAELRKTQSELALSFLTKERANKGSELKAAEQRLAGFMGEHRRFALDATPLAAGAAIRATTPLVGGAVRSPSAPAFRAPSAAAAPAAPGAPAPVPAAAESEERARALAGLAAARANLADQLRRFTPAHPDVHAAEGQVERATARLLAAGAVERPATAAAADLPRPAPGGAEAPTVSARPAPRAVAGVAGVAAPTDDVVALETEWSKLTREVTAMRQRLDQVEAELFKAEVVAASERAGRAVQISIIDPAFLPQHPVGPPPNTVMSVFVAVAVALGLVMAGLVAVLDNHVYLGADVARLGPVLAEVPKMKWRWRNHAPR